MLVCIFFTCLKLKILYKLISRRQLALRRVGDDSRLLPHQMSALCKFNIPVVVAVFFLKQLMLPNCGSHLELI